MFRVLGIYNFAFSITFRHFNLLNQLPLKLVLESLIILAFSNNFQMATMARSGNLVARTIRLENPAAPVKYQGVVNSIQEDKSFGFIERADVVREVSFGFSNCFLGIKVIFKMMYRVFFSNFA
jgi:hypothetical protein